MQIIYLLTNFTERIDNHFYLLNQWILLCNDIDTFTHTHFTGYIYDLYKKRLCKSSLQWINFPKFILHKLYKNKFLKFKKIPIWKAVGSTETVLK
jgi:hypothetical protein